MLGLQSWELELAGRRNQMKKFEMKRQNSDCERERHMVFDHCEGKFNPEVFVLTSNLMFQEGVGKT